MTTGTRYSIERSILATYLYNSFALDNEFELIISEPIKWKLFKSTLTAKACAKAIHIMQEKDLPFDEVTVVKFMEEKMAVDPEFSEELLKTLKKHDTTNDATVIGTTQEGKARVILKTEIGGKKILQVPYGEPVPRVC